MEEEVLFKIEITGDPIQSINNIRKATKELTAERNALNLSTDQGRKRAEEINKVIDANNTKIKENSSALEKQRQNVGNYTRSILDAIPGMGGFSKGLSGINATMKANPVGLLITAFVALKGIFESNAKVADELSFAFAGLTKGFGSIIDTIVTTVSSFDKLGEAILHPIEFMKSLVGGTIDAAKAGYEAAEAIDAFTVAQAKANQAIELTQVSIESLEKSLKDKTKSEQERIKIATEIANLEIENANRRQKLAQQELDNENLRLKGKTLAGEEEAALVKLQTAVLVEEAKVRTIEAGKQSRINVLLAKEEAKAIKEERDALSKSDIERIEKSKGFEVELLKNSKLTELQITKDINAEIAISNKQLEDKNIEFKLESAKVQQQIQKENIAKTGMAINQTADLFKKGSIQQRVLASAGALINTYQAATAALAPPPLGAGPIFGPIFAGISIATGLANVAKINAIGFANGGLTGTRISSGMGIPVTRSNGDNMLATVKTGEVILNQSQQARLGGARTFASIGVPGFASGGLTSMTRGAAIASEGSIRNNQLLRSISQMRIVTTVEDINLGQARVAEIVDRAQVL